MKKSFNIQKLLLAVLFLELVIFVWAYTSEANISEAFRISARISAIVYLFTFYFFSVHFYPNTEISRHNLSKLILIFGVVHFIHFIFLATNIYLNKVELIPYKLAGGILAYLMILLFPFFVNNVNLPHWTYYVYFYYVGIVFVITYLSRIKGEFTGADPSIFHYIGLIAVLASFVLYPFVIYKKKSLK